VIKNYSTLHSDQSGKVVAECDVNDPLACNKDLFEVCTFTNGTYRCLCPKDVSRLPDGRCKGKISKISPKKPKFISIKSISVSNECSEPRLNDCHQNAHCIDTADSFSCQCKAGFADLSQDKLNKPGRLCQEREIPYFDLFVLF